MESKSFTYYSHNSMKDELVNLTENQLNELRAFYVERYVDNMETKDLVQYVMDDMMRYMEALPDNEVVDECLNYWDDHFCLLYTSPSPRDATLSRMPSSA